MTSACLTVGCVQAIATQMMLGDLPGGRAFGDLDIGAGVSSFGSSMGSLGSSKGLAQPFYPSGSFADAAGMLPSEPQPEPEPAPEPASELEAAGPEVKSDLSGHRDELCQFHMGGK